MLEELKRYLEAIGASQDDKLRKKLRTCIRIVEEDYGERPLSSLDKTWLEDAGVDAETIGRFMGHVSEYLRESGAEPTPAPAPLSYAGGNAGAAKGLLRSLAAAHGETLASVADSWPAPLAHEYHRLAEELRDGTPVTVLWQLDDCYEMTMKFACLALASDVLFNAPDSALRAEIRNKLFAILSGGSWSEIWNALAKAAKRSDWLTLPALVDPARCPVASPGFLSAFGKMITYRNATKGHGALGYDQLEQVKGLQPHLEALIGVLSKCPGAWEGLLLHDGNPATPWRGWQQIRNRHRDDAGKHTSEHVSLFLRDATDNRELKLSPLVAVRRCSHCDKCDVFFYDSYASKNKVFYLLDHLAGHRMSPRAMEVDDLRQLAETFSLETLQSDSVDRVDEGGLSSDFVDWASRALEEKRYVSPEYLFKPVWEALTAERDVRRSVLLVTAPAMVGKSVFANHIEAWIQEQAKGRWVVTCFQAKRGVLGTLYHFEAFLDDKILKRNEAAGGFGFTPDKQPMQISTYVDELTKHGELDGLWPRAFARRLTDLMACSKRAGRALLIVVDGLDELPANSATEGVGACLDHPQLVDLLPEDCHLLLTARPAADCGSMRPVTERLEAMCASTGTHFVIEPASILNESADANPLSQAYRALLASFFVKRLAERVRFEARRLASGLAAVRAAHASTYPAQDDFEHSVLPRLPKRWREQKILQAWQAGLGEPSNSSAGSDASAGSPPSTAEWCSPLLAYVPESLFDILLERALGRFGYFEHIVRLLEEGIVPADKVALLPQGEALYSHYLDELKRLLEPPRGNESDAPKRSAWQDIVRLLAVLAAEERAYNAEHAAVASFMQLPPYQGLTVAEIAEALEMPPTYSLLKLLIQLRPLLASFRLGSERFDTLGLGVRDLQHSVAFHFPNEIVAGHRLLASLFLNSESRLYDNGIRAIWNIVFLDQSLVIDEFGKRLHERAGSVLHKNANQTRKFSMSVQLRYAFSELVLMIKSCTSYDGDFSVERILRADLISKIRYRKLISYFADLLFDAREYNSSLKVLDFLVLELDRVYAIKLRDSSDIYGSEIWIIGSLGAALCKRGLVRREGFPREVESCRNDYDRAVGFMRKWTEVCGDEDRRDALAALSEAYRGRSSVRGALMSLALADQDRAVNILDELLASTSCKLESDDLAFASGLAHMSRAILMEQVVSSGNLPLDDIDIAISRFRSTIGGKLQYWQADDNKALLALAKALIIRESIFERNGTKSVVPFESGIDEAIDVLGFLREGSFAEAEEIDYLHNLALYRRYAKAVQSNTQNGLIIKDLSELISSLESRMHTHLGLYEIRHIKLLSDAYALRGKCLSGMTKLDWELGVRSYSLAADLLIKGMRVAGRDHAAEFRMDLINVIIAKIDALMIYEDDWKKEIVEELSDLIDHGILLFEDIEGGGYAKNGVEEILKKGRVLRNFLEMAKVAVNLFAALRLRKVVTFGYRKGLILLRR